jgi:hypothetical protein
MLASTTQKYSPNKRNHSPTVLHWESQESNLQLRWQHSQCYHSMLRTDTQRCQGTVDVRRHVKRRLWARCIG